MATKAKDMYTQLAYMSVTESAVNTLTFQGLSVFSNVMQSNAMIIHRIDYYLTAYTLRQLTASADALLFGVGGDDTLATIDPGNAQVYDYQQIQQLIHGTPANAQLVNQTYRVDFSTLPGGGRIVPADRLYGFVQGTSLADVATVNIRVHFTITPLSAQEYLELAQSLRVLT